MNEILSTTQMSFDFNMLYPSCSVVNSKFSESRIEKKLLRKTCKLAGTVILKQRLFKRYLYMRLHVSVTVTVQIVNFCVMSPCSAIDGFLHFGGTAVSIFKVGVKTAVSSLA